MQDLSIVIPIYQESHEIVQKLFTEIKSLGAEVIVVDDGSKEPYPDAIKHGTNFGYGSALMTGIKNATRSLILTMDGDGQHEVSEAVKLYHAYKLMGNVDMVIGTRRLENEKILRYLGRKFLNWTASLVCLYWLNDLNSGCRIFKRSIAIGYFPILCRQFSFTTSLTINMICDRYRVEFFPILVQPRKEGSTKVRVIKDGIVTLYFILRNGFALRTRRFREFLRRFLGPLHS